MALQLDCGGVNVNDVVSNPDVHHRADDWLEDLGHRCALRWPRGVAHVLPAVVAPRTNVGAGGSYYNNSPKALKRMNTMMTKLALVRPRRMAT